MKTLTWSIKEIVEILDARRKNKFDSNIAVSGDRGNGKSTLVGKMFYRFQSFDPWKHQVYNRDDIIKLLKKKFGYCWDDEAINSGYKRNFQQKGQQELIKILTAYRDNFNVFASAIPNFFSLDKDLRDLYFLHLHVIERGIAVVHMPIQGRLYSQDRWDALYNSKIEQKWSKKISKDPNFKPPYHRLTTFRGYLYFNKLTEKQEALYLEVKQKKRAESFKEVVVDTDPKTKFFETTFKMLLENRLTKEGLIQACMLNGYEYTNTIYTLNNMLRNSGYSTTTKDYLKEKKLLLNNNNTVGINNLVPDI